MFIKGNSRLINLKGQAEILKSADNKTWMGQKREKQRHLETMVTNKEEETEV